MVSRLRSIFKEAATQDDSALQYLWVVDQHGVVLDVLKLKLAEIRVAAADS